jgi:hypothetical protein
MYFDKRFELKDEDEFEGPPVPFDELVKANIACDIDLSEMHEWLTVREVAREMKVDETTVRNWGKKGLLTMVEIGHGLGGLAGIYVKPEDLKRFRASYVPRQRRKVDT